MCKYKYNAGFGILFTQFNIVHHLVIIKLCQYIYKYKTLNNSKHSGFVEDRNRSCFEDHRRFSAEDQRRLSAEETRLVLAYWPAVDAMLVCKKVL